jgi:hypothetical protein
LAGFTPGSIIAGFFYAVKAKFLIKKNKNINKPLIGVILVHLSLKLAGLPQ